jgi:hypothetical protein
MTAAGTEIATWHYPCSFRFAPNVNGSEPSSLYPDDLLRRMAKPELGVHGSKLEQQL